MKNVLVLLAEGFEEIEAVSVIDIVRRAGIPLTVAGLGGIKIKGAHDIYIDADVVLDENIGEYAVVVLPGGGKGTENLGKSELVKKILLKQKNGGRYIAAICAAPTVLAKHKLIDGVAVTSFPGTEDSFDPKYYKTDAVVSDGQFLTSRAAGTAADFGFAIVSILAGGKVAAELKAKMYY